jgi:ParB-like chromosome segregation protein Spo0J
MTSEPLPLAMEMWPLSRFVEYESNPRNNDAAVDRMCDSIREFGFKIPCVVRRDGELVDGHLRLKAARKLGLANIPVVLCNEWTSAQVKAFRLLVNRSATWAGWDPELLALELQKLERAGYDLSLTGFDTAELDEFLGSGPAIVDRAEAVPPVPEVPVSQAGDLWRLGPHRVLCGDATDAQAVARLLGESKPRLMVADPPYGTEVDSVGGDKRADWSEAFALAPSLEVAYVWHASEFTREVLDGLLRIGFEDHQQIIWDRGEVWGRSRVSNKGYRVQHEPCWYVRKKNAPWFGKAGEKSTIWTSSPNPTQRPVELMRTPIVNHLRRGEVVYDPFLGSGTSSLRTTHSLCASTLSRTTHSLCAPTLAAAELTKRVCYGMELDPKYVDVAVRRWQTLTGKQATHDADGRSFEEIARERGDARMHTKGADDDE